MATLAEIRSQYPQYKDRSDQELADALYNKFYVGKIDKPEFYSKIGLNMAASAPQPEPPPAAQPPQEPSMGQRITGKLQARAQRGQEIQQAVQSGQTPSLLGRIQQAGIVGAGSLADIGGEIIGAGANLIGKLPTNLPQGMPQNIGQAATAGVQAAGQLPSFGGGTIGERIPDELSQLSKQYSGFEQQHPNIARTAESVLSMAPVIPAAKVAKGVIKAPAAVAKAGKTDKFITDLVLERETPSVAEQRALRSNDKGIYQPNAFEKSMADEVRNIKGVSPKNTHQQNLNAIQNEAYAEANKLKSALEAKKVIFPIKELRANLKNRINQTINDSLSISGADAAKTAEKVLSQYDKILAKTPGTPAGLLQARKEFDNYVMKEKPKFFDTATENALSRVIDDIRMGTNDFINQKVPDVKVKESLARQHKLFTARDNIAPKVRLEKAEKLKKKEAVKGYIGKAAAGAALGAGGTAAYNVLK